MAVSDFFSQYAPYAQSVNRSTGIDPRIVLAQAALETGYGRSAPNYNLFGIKGKGSTQQTKEFVDGKMVSMPQEFRSYGSPEESFKDYASLMSGKRYEGVRSGGTLEDQIAALQKSGYATDPEYGQKVMQIAKGINLEGLPMNGPTQQQPQGLLGGLLGGQGIGGALGLSDDFRDRLAMGIMAGSDPRQFAPLIQQRAQSIQERKVTSRTKAQANATADYLEKIGQGDIANLLRQGGIDAKTALSAGTSKTKETADIQEYRLAQSQGYKGTFEAWQQLGKKKTEFGTIPVGYQLVEGATPDGQPTYQMVPVEGSPAYIEEQERRRKQAKKGEGGDVMATNVLQTAGRARNLTSGWTVGYGQLLAGLPATDARELKAEVDALQAIASSENLNRMRQESPTGGALGNVSDADIKLLKDKSGALDPMSKPEVFAKQLDEYELLLLQTIHGTEAGTKLFGQTRGMYGQYSFEVEGQTSDKNAQNRSRFPNAPDIGTVSQGHVYNGGNPSDPKSWSAQ
jgi:hypothetical protein